MRPNKTKRTVKQVFLLALIALLLVQSVCALGVAPSRQVLDYSEQPIVKTARILNNEGRNFRVALYPQGELANYIALDKQFVNIKETDGEVEFSYTINPPKDLPPGKRVGGIVVLELPDEFVENENVIVTDETSIIFNSKKEDNTMITATQAVITQVHLNIPYPDSFAEAVLYINPAQTGDKFEFTISLYNRGNQPFDAQGYVSILDPSNREVGRIDLSQISLQASDSGKMIGIWQPDVNAGEYKAVAVITYAGKSVKVEKVFEVGNFFVEVKDVDVKNFRLGTVAMFEIDLLSRWNKKIDGVSGEMQILESGGTVIAEFQTTTANIPALGEETIYGYWDTEDVGIGEYDVNIVLSYQGKTTSKLFETVVGLDEISFSKDFISGKVTGSSGEKGTNYTLFTILVIVLIVFNIVLFVMFKRRGSNRQGGGGGRPSVPAGFQNQSVSSGERSAGQVRVPSGKQSQSFSQEENVEGTRSINDQE